VTDDYLSPEDMDYVPTEKHFRDASLEDGSFQSKDEVPEYYQ
jgi:hypothetical protein